MKAPVQEGFVVISQKGRDKGRPFVVLYEMSADFVMVCDGKTHPLEKLKKKRKKHLASTRFEYPDLVRRFQNKSLMNEDVRRALGLYLSAGDDDAAANKEGRLFVQK